MKTTTLLNGLAVAGLVTSSASAASIEPYWHFSGVFHPAVSHFPIGLLMVAGAIELFRMVKPGKSKRKGPSDAAYVCIVLGTLAAIVTATLGWANADASGEFNGTLQEVASVHRWLGVAVCGVGLLATIFATVARRRTTTSNGMRWSMRVSTLAAAALVGLVGSYGGKLTHGVDYYNDALEDLTAALDAQSEDRSTAHVLESAITDTPTVDSVQTPSAKNDTEITKSKKTTLAKSDSDPGDSQLKTDPVLPPNATGNTDETVQTLTVSFKRDVQPIFSNYCIKCHSEKKVKGGYRLDTKSMAFTAGDSEEPPIVPGNSSESLMVKVIEGAPGYEDDMMPPKGSLLSKSEVAIVKKWIDEGAVWDMPDADAVTGAE